MRFTNREHAGRELAERLKFYKGRDDVVVLGLPRGGVIVAAEIADALGVSMDIYIVRKLGVPGQPELAMGAVASDGSRVVNEEVVASLGVSPAAIERVAERETAELQRRQETYRGDRAPPAIAGKTVIVADDGLATGASMKVAVKAIRASGPKTLIVAVGAAPAGTVAVNWTV